MNNNPESNNNIQQNPVQPAVPITQPIQTDNNTMVQNTPVQSTVMVQPTATIGQPLQVDNNTLVQNTPVQSTVTVQPTATIEQPIQTDNNTVVQNIPVQSTVPVQPTTTPSNTVQEKEPEEKNIIALLLIIGLIAVIVATVIYFYVIKDEDSDKPVKQNTQTEENKSNVNVSVWNGSYEKDNITINIYQTSDNLVTVDIISTPNDTNSTNFQSMGVDIDVKSETKIAYEDDFLEEGANIVIEKTSNGITVTSSSDEADSLLNSISGSYEKNVFNTYGWNGTYKNGAISIVLSEIDEDYIMCTITKGYSTTAFPFKEISENTLSYEDSFGDRVVKIVRNETGFEITAKDEDPEALLNEVNGIYTKE